MLLKKMDRAMNPGWIYVIQCKDFYKIGKTNSVGDRLRSLQTANPFPLQVKFKKFVSDCSYWEEKLHQIFASKRRNGEWFELDEGNLRLLELLFTSQEIIDTFGVSNGKIGVVIKNILFVFTPTMYNRDTSDNEELRPKQIYKILKNAQLENSNIDQKDIEFVKLVSKGKKVQFAPITIK